MTRLRPWAIAGLAIVFIALLGLAACAPAPRIVVVRCDYAVMPVGAAGITAADSIREAWRDSVICQMRIDMARAGIKP